MKLNPVGPRAVVEIVPRPQKSEGGILLPGDLFEEMVEGRVLAVGKKYIDGKWVDLEVKPGDKILFQRYAGQEVELGNKKYTILKEDEIALVFG